MDNIRVFIIKEKTETEKCIAVGIKCDRINLSSLKINI